RFANGHAWLRWRPGSATVGVGNIGTVDHSSNRVPIDHRQVEVRQNPSGLRDNRTADRLKVWHRIHAVTLRDFAHKTYVESAATGVSEEEPLPWHEGHVRI